MSGNAVMRCLLLVMLSCAVVGDYVWESYDFPEDSDHPCARECSDLAPPRLCEYTFLLENFFTVGTACGDCPTNQSHCFNKHCVPADGVPRLIKTANRRIPGPSIQVCEGDTIKVHVKNLMQMGEGTSIHWHGVLQQGTPHMDGVSSVTQCAVSAMSTFTYKFLAENPGTHYWHAHSGLQRADGLFGALVVRRAPGVEPHWNLYDHDLADHFMVVTDWLSEGTMSRFAGHHHSDANNMPGNILINGHGIRQVYTDVNGTEHVTPRATFTVTPGHTYRFRVISSTFLSCPVQISIDNHTLLMIASDGSSIEPYSVESFVIYSGERFDFILHTSESLIGNHWIRARGIGYCVRSQIHQTAILKYQGAGDELPAGTPTWEDGDRQGKLLNPSNTKATDELVQISSMRSTEHDDDTMTSDPDQQIYIGMDFKNISNPKYSIVWMRQLNGISLHLPPSPPLSQYTDVPQDMYCNAETVQVKCEENFCQCVHLYKVGLNDLVEMVLVDEGVPFNANHPMHLHGYRFRVVAMDRVGEKTSVQEIRALDARGEMNRTLSGAPFKDTVTVPDGGYTTVRFRASNPGIWFLHCHIEFHAEIGMGLLIQVGDHTEFPKPPKGFPTCGNYDTVYTDAEDDEDEDDDDDDTTNPHCPPTTGRSRATIFPADKLALLAALVWVSLTCRQ